MPDARPARGHAYGRARLDMDEGRAVAPRAQPAADHVGRRGECESYVHASTMSHITEGCDKQSRSAKNLSCYYKRQGTELPSK
ncbi:hypothetical protein BM221_006693 [Beauveria bassiana]|uniref:Uncharacterized protein n=1 Tax=Beauveria bassiana TaxID=176275 RepID=A0A2N6NIE3_BEABA|nr:hypothetical protein BM221_006693 [Beauveria bassiana]